MKIIMRVILTLLIPFQLLAQNPVLTSLSPSRFQTQSEPTTMRLTINGNDMWPKHLTITMTIQVMHIHFKRDGRDEVIRGSGISSTSQSLWFTSTGWLDKPGQVEVYITIDAFGGYPAYRSNSLFFTVDPTSTSAPVINNLSNSSFKTGIPKEKYYIRVYGKNFGEIRSTSVSIGGNTASIGYANLTDGVIDVWVPAAVYGTAGEYPVQVRTKYGTSNTMPLKIESALMTLKPGVLGPKPVTSTPATKVRPMGNTVATTRLITLNSENNARLNETIMRGARVTMVGQVTSASISAEFENYILSLENIFVVDNQLVIADTPGNININLKTSGIDRAAAEKIKKQIEDKASEIKIGVGVVIE